MQELQNCNNQLNMELISSHEKNKTEKDVLHDRNRHLESQLHHFKNEMEKKQELARDQLEVCSYKLLIEKIYIKEKIILN